jgi:DNA replication protein DnaC
MATDWVRDTMYMLVNYRLNHLKPTVITSNLLLGEIAETYHARLASRLAGEFAIDMNLLPDYRLVKS